MNEFILIAVISYISLIFHELSHYLVYKVFSVSVRKVYILPIEFRHSEKPEFKLSTENGIFGLVVPDLDSSSDNKRMRDIIALSLISAPAMHIIIAAVAFIAYLNSETQILLFITLINLIMFLSTLSGNENAVGDTLAVYHIIRSDKQAEKIFGYFFDDNNKRQNEI